LLLGPLDDVRRAVHDRAGADQVAAAAAAGSVGVYRIRTQTVVGTSSCLADPLVVRLCCRDFLDDNGPLGAARRERGESPTEIAKALGVSRASIYRHLSAAES
jgi:hypothetical protein